MGDRMKVIKQIERYRVACSRMPNTRRLCGSANPFHAFHVEYGNPNLGLANVR